MIALTPPARSLVEFCNNEVKRTKLRAWVKSRAITMPCVAKDKDGVGVD